MSDEISDIIARANRACGFFCACPRPPLPPRRPRPPNPVSFFRMTGEGCSLPTNTEIFTLCEQIGSGSFSHVYRAIEKQNFQSIAIKSYRMKKKDFGHFSRAATEMAFLRFLEHPNIIGYIHSEIKNQYMYLAIQYSPHGCLSRFIVKNVGIGESVVQFIMRQLISALCYLHSMNIFHGDVKPENIIVSYVEGCYLHIKLTDFGLADVNLENQLLYKKSGSFYYMAPEILMGFPSDYKSDLFSAGVVMFEMIFADKPYSTKVSRDTYIKLLKKTSLISKIEVNYLSNHCKHLMKNLLSYNKEERLFGEELAKHPFLFIELITDKESHYMKACECLVRGMDLVSAREFGLGYIEITEAILHLKIHMNHIRYDKVLYDYTLSRYRDYTRYCEEVELKLVSEKNLGPLIVATQSERLRCLLKSSPNLLAGYDICSVGEMYYVQCKKQQGLRMIKDGLNIIFPLMPHEPEGLRKHMLNKKINRWVTVLEATEPENDIF